MYPESSMKTTVDRYPVLLLTNKETSRPSERMRDQIATSAPRGSFHFLD